MTTNLSIIDPNDIPEPTDEELSQIETELEKWEEDDDYGI